MDSILQLFRCPPSPPTFNIGMSPSCTLFIFIFDGPGPGGAPILNVGGAGGFTARTVARLRPSTVCRKSENEMKNKQGPPFPMHNLFVRCCFYFEACVWKLIVVIALALHWLAFKPVWRGCSKQRRTTSAAKSERPLIVLPGARE